LCMGKGGKEGSEGVEWTKVDFCRLGEKLYRDRKKKKKHSQDKGRRGAAEKFPLEGGRNQLSGIAFTKRGSGRLCGGHRCQISTRVVGDFIDEKKRKVTQEKSSSTDRKKKGVRTRWERKYRIPHRI